MKTYGAAVMRLTTTEEELALRLLHSDDEDEVDRILEEYGYPLSDESLWRPLGDNPGNFSTVGNQQEDGTAAIVEKLINSIDAVLLSACYTVGVDPRSDDAPNSMREGVEKFLGVRDGRLDFMDTDEQRELSEHIHFVATGSKTSPCYTIIDKGEGQTPESFPSTFLTASRDSPKININFVQGKFAAGGTGSLQFCGKHNIQLIISRRQPHALTEVDDPSADQWGFTIIRRIRPTAKGVRSSIFVYLAPGGKVLRFNAPYLDLLPSDSRKGRPVVPYSKPLSHGSCVKLYNYRWAGRSTATLEARRQLERELQVPCLPFRISETRRYTANYYANTVTGIWSDIQRDLAAGKSKMEEGFPGAASVAPEKLGTLPINVAVWKEEVKPKNVPTGVYFLVNGQVHGSYSKDFISRRLKFDYIGNHMLIAVDCTNMNRVIAEDLLMASRDRLRRNEHYDTLRSELARELRDHEGLKEANARWRQRRRERAAKEPADVDVVFAELVRRDPTLASLLGIGGRIRTGAGPGLHSKFSGKKFPSYFRLCESSRKFLEKKCPLNATVKVEFETDVENSYFRRPVDPGELSIEPTMDLVESSRLWNGKMTFRFRVPWDAKVGDRVKVSASVSDVSQIEPLSAEFELEAAPLVTKEKTRPGKPNPPRDPKSPRPSGSIASLSPPRPYEVRKPDWSKHGFEGPTDAMRVKSGDEGSGYDFYVNIDNAFLISASADHKSDPALLKYWFIWGLTIAAFGMIKNEKDRLAGSGEEPALDQISRACDGLSQVIIPIIRALHDGPKEGTEGM